MVYFDPNVGFVDESNLRSDNVELRARLEMVEESFDEAATAMLRLREEDEGWSILGQVKGDDGFARNTILEISRKAEVQSVGNPLLKHGFDLRFNPIFSRGFTLNTVDGTSIKPRHQRKLDNETVKETLFTADGYEQLERTCFNVGNLFIAYNRVTGDVLRIPLSQITNRAVDPDFPARTAYYQWSHTKLNFDGSSENIVEWLPVVEWVTAQKDTQDEIAAAPVNHNWTMIDMRVNVPTTGHWGLPDVFGALPYAWAYSEYIRDAASLLKALNKIAWKVVGKSKTNIQNAGVQLAGQRKTGGVAAMTAGTDLAAMPKAGQVDMADGMALAAMAASSLGVSTAALITVAQGGTGASVQSLDGPTVAMARARQDRWIRFYERIFAAMSIDGMTINFPKITEDPIYRTIASLATVRATGALWADEYRDAALEALSIQGTHPDAPPVDEYAQAQNALGFISAVSGAAADEGQGKADPLSKQGNAGVAGKLGTTDNAGLRKQDNKAKSGTQTDLVG